MKPSGGKKGTLAHIKANAEKAGPREDEKWKEVGKRSTIYWRKAVHEGSAGLSKGIGKVGGKGELKELLDRYIGGRPPKNAIKNSV